MGHITIDGQHTASSSAKVGSGQQGARHDPSEVGPPWLMGKPLPPHGPVLVESNATANAAGRRSSRKSSTPSAIRPAGMQVVGIIQSNASVNPRPGVKSGEQIQWNQGAVPESKSTAQVGRSPVARQRRKTQWLGRSAVNHSNPGVGLQQVQPAARVPFPGWRRKKQKSTKFQFGQRPRHQTLLTEYCVPCGEVIVVVLYRRRGLSSRSRSRSLRRECELPLCPV